ncbi:tRNA lysidine(34) synthetase TilS [Aetokthonos hydrillicola Thurmond2011]|jgi:tRNA(Ile)-lysidine synthase|uniref:tRNA(Ile)-lysidine synthase n=3 Tax=Aetokthonos TaxID=1550243 RepID=A0AAP5MBG4_9CYAN|nr:tRNA lysidine(34) synthetase TilS [Aetokthonos hydrillicola]MBO3457719.1 tRNA lysidine(34) synthetase TilS [Aetokthonos hydrillicola CCALA 1050]MBW4589430.1 tRNA lysidine(34) synthetase TilS [Aetokthonos hydrillicola CCALA 1050]MDR9897093.1 tRNA lysidine(34) synthetase TilS [Aetokthonos hydrillicola Thurmond2011]
MPWTPLHAKIHRTIRSRQLFRRDQRLLVAVSGGQDSLCLIRLLLDLQPKWGWDLAIAHCDHRWRSDSQANANYVENLAKSWGTSFYLQIANTPLNSEAAGRDWRYQALSAIAVENHYDYVVTGHTASDRAETLLYNLIRGTGADGLQALSWQRELTKSIVLVRPLLEVTRSQTGLFCQESDLPIWEDCTNKDLKYARNRIREHIIPYLQENFNPQVETALAQTAELLQAEVEYLEQIADELKQEVIYLPNDRCVGINRRRLKESPIAIQRRVIRQVLQQILNIAPSFEHIEKLVALITAPNRSQTDPFPGGVKGTVEGEWIYLE